MQYTGSEGDCWVVGCATCLQAVDVQDTQPYRHELFPETEEWENPGDAGVYRPLGTLHAGPMRKEKGLPVAEIDVDAAAPVPTQIRC